MLSKQMEMIGRRRLLTKALDRPKPSQSVNDLEGCNPFRPCSASRGLRYEDGKGLAVEWAAPRVTMVDLSWPFRCHGIRGLSTSTDAMKPGEELLRGAKDTRVPATRAAVDRSHPPVHGMLTPSLWGRPSAA